MDFEAKIFGSKTFSDILKNIYDNSKEKERQILLRKEVHKIA